MFKVLVLVVFFSVVKCELNPILTHRGIVGGTVLRGDHRHPHQISLQQSGQHCCGGSILSCRVIITAAHCVYKSSVKQFTVVVGITTLRDPCKTYLLQKIEIHNEYNPHTMINDIAILVTNKEIVFNNRVQPIKLDDTICDEPRELTVTGWGNIKHEGPISGDLREVKLLSLSHANCCKRQPGGQPAVIHNKQICTLLGPGTGVCMGDSGGPLITADGKLCGLVSYGRTCASGYPDVFTRVAGFLDWINKRIKDNIC